MQKDKHDLLLKLVLVGDCGVGKTQFLQKFISDKFNLESKSTVGVSYLSRDLIIEGKVIKAQIWDASGADKTSTIAKSFYKGAVGALIMYDITHQPSFTDVEKWLKELSDYADPQLLKILVGNKSDLKFLRTIKTEEGQKFAEINGLQFIETSALDGSDVSAAVEKIVSEIYQIFKRVTSGGKR